MDGPCGKNNGVVSGHSLFFFLLFFVLFLGLTRNADLGCGLLDQAVDATEHGPAGRSFLRSRLSMKDALQAGTYIQ